MIWTEEKKRKFAYRHNEKKAQMQKRTQRYCRPVRKDHDLD